MKWGRRWGNLWGKDSVDPVHIMDFEEIPPAALAYWDAVAADVLYHVYVDGKYYDTTHATEIMVQFTQFGRHWIEVFASGNGNIDEDLSAFVSSIPGTRVKLTWTTSLSTDLDHYDIYWKVAGNWVYLSRTKSTENCYITEPLSDATYEFRVDPVDAAGNSLTSASTGSKSVARYPDPPGDIVLDLFDETTGVATFSFSESTTVGVTGYHVYHNSGVGDIDYGTTRETVLPGNTQFTLSGLSAGEWSVGIRAYNATYKEDNVDEYCEFELGGSPLDLLESQPNTPEALAVVPAENGTFTCKCSYCAYQEAGMATQINFYANNGAGGSIFFLATVATATVPEHTQGDMSMLEIVATTSVLAHGQTYLFIARAVTAGGRESDNSNQAGGVADSIAPTDISGLTLAVVNYEGCDELEI